MKNAFSFLFSLLLVTSAFAERDKNTRPPERNKGNDHPGVAANCNPPTAATELNINNTRALIQSGGDMWWDFSRPRYEIPKGSGKNSLYAGSLWLAGQDISGQFKVAALRFRQGNDYWTGPLSTVDAEIDPATCNFYDRQWETSRSMVAEFVAWFNADPTTREQLFPGYTVPSVILEWPAHGRNFAPYNEDEFLAPFVDVKGDNSYDPLEDGDYPAYVLSGKSDCSRSIKDIYGDQNIWWVFNDKGNIHTESGGQSIGMEIRAQAFAFASTDEVNNMTFYNYELVNRSTFELSDTYFGQWVDGDLGNAGDDYVGCDVRRGLGFFYNAGSDEDAAGSLGYGANPPAIGVDFFQGPFQANDDKDNCLCENDYAAAIEDGGIVYEGQGAGYGDGKLDNERYGMRKFLYHENGGGAIGDPTIATDYYNMLRGIWKDGTPMTYGGSGYAPNDPNAIPAHYMFPGDSDPLKWGTDGVDPGQDVWTQAQERDPGDMRFVQSSGPFQLSPGAVNNITVGVVWAQATAGGPSQSIELMKRADDKTQALFDNCFEIIDGPDAPSVAVQELDREVILMLSNPTGSNNYQESYSSIDPFQSIPDSIDTDGNDTLDSRLTPEERNAYATYTFEGYQIFQLADDAVGTGDLRNPDKARLVAQVDVKNNITRLVNYVYDPLIKADVPQLMVEGANNGIRHSFQFTEDAFASGDARLINHKTYYYMAIAYAYNDHGGGMGQLEHLARFYDPSDAEKLDGQKLPYLASRKSATGPVRVIEVIPHRTEIEYDGVTLNAQYGDGVELTRIEGLGNTHAFVNLKAENQERLFETGENTVPELTFEAGQGPVQVKVVDPLVIPAGDFTLAFVDNSADGDLSQLEWIITGDGLDQPITSEQSIEQRNEQVLFDLGLSVTVGYAYPGRHPKATNNGYVGFDVVFADETDQWLSGIADVDSDPDFNWVKSGKSITPAAGTPPSKDDAEDDHFTSFTDLRLPEPDDTVGIDTAHGLDPEQYWENIAGRTWAPFALASYDTAHPVPMYPNLAGLAHPELSEQLLQAAKLAYTPSVDVYITSDKSKWTRCPVFEAQDNALLTDGGAVRGEMRRALSVDKEGRNQLDAGVNLAEATFNGTQVIGDAALLRQADRTYFAGLGIESDAALAQMSFGMGWFPGYAVDAETGERLNMAFSEDSWLKSENGGDMQWNPTGNITEPLFNELRFGGKHMIYVFRNNIEDASFGVENMMPAYDGGQFAFDRLLTWDPTDPYQLTQATNENRVGYASVMAAAAWVGYPLIAENTQMFGLSGENDVTIRLRSARPYQRYAVAEKQLNPAIASGKGYYVYDGALTVDYLESDGSTASGTFRKGQFFKAAASSYQSVTENVQLVETVNDALPLYHFSTHALAPTKSIAIGQEELEEVKAVPNPYYAYNEYETGRLDTRIKIINLPQACTVNIFTVSGTLVRTFQKDDPSITSLDWDLKNNDQVPIASGLYIIHVKAPGIGETVIKWFGAMRPVDLTAF